MVRCRKQPAHNVLTSPTETPSLATNSVGQPSAMKGKRCQPKWLASPACPQPAAAWFPMVAMAMMMAQSASKLKLAKTAKKKKLPRPEPERSSVAPHNVAVSERSSTVAPHNVVLVAPGSGVGVNETESQLRASEDPVLTQMFGKAYQCQLHDFLPWSSLPRFDIIVFTQLLPEFPAPSC